jgi:DNA-directed RNA polymerase I, II, and III subunit RPABC2
MSSQGLEEFDVEKQLKKDEEPIVLSEKEDLDNDFDNDTEDNVEDDFDNDTEDNVEDDNDDVESNSPESKDADPPQISIKTDNFINNDELDAISSDETDSDDEYEENMNKLEQDINKDMIFSYHPETKQINFKELITLSKVARNKQGHIIDPLHTTISFLTRFEKAKILGLRAKQINHGSKPFVEINRNIIDGHTIALMELVQNKIPFIIRRPLPNGGSEYWKISDLKHLE